MCDGTQSQEVFEERWLNGTCGDNYYNTLAWLDSGGRGYNLSRQQLIRDKASGSFERLLEIQGGSLRNYNEPEFNEVQEAIYEAFINTPQSAVDALTNYCSNFTREEIASSQALLRFCGCYGPNIDDLPDDRQIDKTCDPLCNRGDTVKLPIEGSLNSQKCSNNVCVIDNITIQAAGGSGNVTLEQVCTGCTLARPCTCVISNVNAIDDIRGNVPVQISQSCLPQATFCYDNDIQVPCPEVGSSPDDSSEEEDGLSTAMIIFIIAIVLTILILIISIIVAY